jgi:predicted nucleotidyltransferase
MSVDPDLLAALRSVLDDRTDIALALLFGSNARGRGGPDSDADVAVLGRDLDLLQLRADLSQAIHGDVDVVDLARATYPLTKAVLRDGVLIHQGERGAEARWRSHAISEIETDRPGYERMRDAYLDRLAEGGRG